MLETLSYIFDWRQIINSLVGSVIAATIVVPITIYLFQRVAHWANRKKNFWAYQLQLQVSYFSLYWSDHPL